MGRRASSLLRQTNCNREAGSEMSERSGVTNMYRVTPGQCGPSENEVVRFREHSLRHQCLNEDDVWVTTSGNEILLNISFYFQS